MLSFNWLILCLIINFFIMKKIPLFLMVASLSLFLSACYSKPSLPQNPKNGEEKIDEQGNKWVYNDTGGYWMLYSMMNGALNNSSSYRYYPSSGSWTNNNGVTVNPPQNVSQSFYQKPSIKPNSSGNSAVRSSGKSSSGKVFSGGVRSSRSFGA